jgi:hypothetical protein
VIGIFADDYPLVNLQKLWKITILLLGKSTINHPFFTSYVKLPESMHESDLNKGYLEKSSEFMNLKFESCGHKRG